MRQRIELLVRYWSFLIAKIGIAALVSALLLGFMNFFWLPQRPTFRMIPYLFGFDLLYTTVTGVVFLVSSGLVYLAFLDQRYRCRVCLRRLRMPVETGSWSKMLQFGRPRLEYICIYGHGNLNVEEIQFTGMEQPKWKEHQDMWNQLAKPPDRDR